MTSTPHLRDPANVLLRVEHLTVTFPAGGGRTVHAVSDVSFDVIRGETLGLVGESGCGKSTIGKAIVGMARPTSGSVRFDGQELTTLPKAALRKTRARMQMIFQDPISSLNPRMRIRDIVAEPLDIWEQPSRDARRVRVAQMLDIVGLDEATAGRRPHELSGGQCQRISIARALMLDPQFIICDEPVSSLDVSVQAQILNLLQDMKDRYGLTLLFISHDLAVVKNVSDRVCVMYLGKLCELAASEDLYRSPAHPYTVGLLSAIPVADPDRPPQRHTRISGDLPSATAPPSGCRFRTRCPRAQERCSRDEPEMRQLGENHWVACHFPHLPAA